MNVRAVRSVSMKDQERAVEQAGGKVKPPRKPRQKRLPNMEDEKLDELHGLAEDYVDVRDKRIALLKEESPLKQSLLNAMKRHEKMHYKHNGLEITVVHESEKVRVKLHKEAEDDE